MFNSKSRFGTRQLIARLTSVTWQESGGARRACRSSAAEAVRRRDGPTATSVAVEECVLFGVSTVGCWGYGVGWAASTCMARVAAVFSAGSVSGALVQMR